MELEERVSSVEIISDYSKQNLTSVPPKLLFMSNLKMIFLEGNLIDKIPRDFFPNLPNLTWLDLRNNQISEIPKNIMKHAKLEYLFFTNNCIVKLPNELGTIPNLKAIQVANNPIEYPPKKILVKGTPTIKKFLQDQYDKTTSYDKVQNDELEEVVIEVNDYCSSKSSVSKQSKKFSTRIIHPTNTFELPSAKKVSSTKTAKSESDRIVHKLNRSHSRISLRSYFNKIEGKLKLIDIKHDENLRDAWLNKLRLLLADQEKILQQERNLRALSSWRHEKSEEQIRSLPKDKLKSVTTPPFATYKDYDKIPTREDLSKELQSFMLSKKTSSAIRSGCSLKVQEIENAIQELVEQLKALEDEQQNQNSSSTSSRSATQALESQMKTIMNIHKKLLWLQTSNDTSV